MGFGILVLCFGVGLLFGSLSIIEWLVVRIARRLLAKPSIPKRARIPR